MTTGLIANLVLIAVAMPQNRGAGVDATAISTRQESQLRRDAFQNGTTAKGEMSSALNNVQSRNHRRLVLEQRRLQLAPPGGYLDPCTSSAECIHPFNCNPTAGRCDSKTPGHLLSLCTSAADCVYLLSDVDTAYCNTQATECTAGDAEGCGKCNEAADFDFDGICRTNQDCAAGLVCTTIPGYTQPLFQRCLKPAGDSCLMDYDCASLACLSDGTCQAHASGAPCSETAQCQPGLVCYADEWTCSAPILCVSTADCVTAGMPNTYCNGNQCQNLRLPGAPGCTGDADCAGGGLCQTGTCACASNADCQVFDPTYLCDSSGLCVAPLPTSRTCSTNTDCASGFCSSSSSSSNTCACVHFSDCPSDEYCSENDGTAPSCQPRFNYQETCSADYECLSGKCDMDGGGFCSELCNEHEDCDADAACNFLDPPTNTYGFCFVDANCNNTGTHNTGDPCGTISPTDCELELLNLISGSSTQRRNLREDKRMLRTGAPPSWVSLFQEEDRGLSSVTHNYLSAGAAAQLQKTAYVIKVRFHVLHNSASQSFPESVAEGMVKTLNSVFYGISTVNCVLGKTNRPTPFCFKFEGSTRFTQHYSSSTKGYQDSWHYIAPANANVMKTALRVGSRKVLNVFMGDPTALNVLGVSTFPYQLVTTEGQGRDGIILQNPALMTGGLTSVNKKEIKMTLVHEVGHWLGLYHTFEGTSCSSSGTDGVDDTGRQKCPGWDNSGWKNCFQNRANLVDTCGSEGTCTDSDASGCDPLWNFMDYSDYTCMESYGHFTQGQVDRMEQQHRCWRLEDYSACSGRRRRGRRLSTGGTASSSTDASCVAALAEQCNCDFRCIKGLFWPLFHEAGAPDMFENAVLGCNECLSDASCPSSHYCSGPGDYEMDTIYGLHCQDKNFNGAPCEDNGQCYSGFCLHTGQEAATSAAPGMTGRCAGGVGDTCTPGGTCANGLTCDPLERKCPDIEHVPNGITIPQIDCSSDPDGRTCPTNLCDTTTGKCKKCSEHFECEAASHGGRYCDHETGTRVCRVKKTTRGPVEACSSDNECFSGRCEANVCVECVPGEALAWGVCDGRGRVVECLDSTDCADESTQYCDTGRNKCNQKLLTGMTEMACYRDEHCSSGTCHNRECTIPCQDNTDCDGNPLFGECVNYFCEVQQDRIKQMGVPNPPLVTFSCSRQTDCHGKLFSGGCDLGLGICVQACTDVANCTDAGYDTCRFGSCGVACVFDEDCSSFPAIPVCHAQQHICVPVASVDECVFGHDCPAADESCHPSANVCVLTSSIDTCTTDNDCVTNEFTYCHPTAGVCILPVPCENDASCPPSLPACDITLAAPMCTPGTGGSGQVGQQGCGTGPACQAPQVCENGACVTAGCGGGPSCTAPDVCHPIDDFCVPSDSITYCTTSMDCRSTPWEPICDTTAGICVR